MKISDIKESQVYKKITDPKQQKQLAIAVYNDNTFPRASIARLGPRPRDEDVVKMFSDELDKALSDTSYGDISKSGKYDQFILKNYLNHAMDFEDFSGEGSDLLGGHAALVKRGLLTPAQSDMNQVGSLRNLKVLMNHPHVQQELRRIKGQAVLDAMKKGKKEIVILDNDKYWVSVPLNYAACYSFNNGIGHLSTYCTGSSNRDWWITYSKDGPLIDIVDKEKYKDQTGKYQIHAPTRQIKNSNQQDQYSRDEVFAKNYPGLLKQIGSALLQHKDELENASTEMTDNQGNQLLGRQMPEPWDINKTVSDLKSKFPLSWNSGTKGVDSDDQLQL